jgi:hypothetical protein
MKRLQQFLGREVDLDLIRNDDDLLASLSIEKRYVPEELEIFDELEFGLGSFGSKTTVLMLVLEDAKLQRVSLGWIPEGGDEDDFAAFTEAELSEVMDEVGPRIVSFFEKTLTP